MKIKQRDIWFVALGAFLMLAFVIAYDWADFVAGFTAGLNGTPPR